MSYSGETIGSRISQMLKELKLTPNAFAAKVRSEMPEYKLSHTTVKRYIENEYEPKPIFYKAVYKIFGYPENKLRYGKQDKEYSDRVSDSVYSNVKDVNIYTRVAAGLPAEIWDNPKGSVSIGFDGLEKIKKDIYSFVVIGDSMVNEYSEGDIVFCTQINLANGETPHDDEIVVIFIGHKSEAGRPLLKRFRWADSEHKSFILESFNAKAQVFHIKDVQKIFRVHFNLSIKDKNLK